MSTRVTTYFGIKSTVVDFVDVDVHNDNRLYVDPSAIRNAAAAKDPWAMDAYSILGDFFDEVLRHLNDPTLHGPGRALLAQFGEPRETRLGMSEFGFDGSGISDGIGGDIWDAMLTNPLCRLDVPILRRVEHLPLFISDVSNDRISDLTSRVIYSKLVEFTQEQMAIHPELASTTVSPALQIWDTAKKGWAAPVVGDLPKVRSRTGKETPLVLVPKRFVYFALRMSDRSYWSTTVIGKVQEDERVVLRDGRISRTPKYQLKKRSSLQAVIPTNIRLTDAAYTESQRNLIKEYEQNVDRKFVPLSDDEIDRRLSK